MDSPCEIVSLDISRNFHFRVPQPNIRQSPRSVFGRVRDRIGKPEGVKDNTRRPLESNNLRQWGLTEFGPPSRGHTGAGPRPSIHFYMSSLQTSSLVFMWVP